MTFRFDLTISNLTKSEAEALLAFLTEEAEYYHAVVSGGMAEVSENDGAADGEAADGETHA